MTEPRTITPLEILNLPMGGNEAGEDTVRGYLVELLATLWRDGDCFSGKHPFGTSGWECELHEPLVVAGLVREHPEGMDAGHGVVHPDDWRAAKRLIREAIEALRQDGS